MTAVADQLRAFLYTSALVVAVGTVWAIGWSTELEARLSQDVPGTTVEPAPAGGPPSLADVAGND